ncbi:DNA-binding transcriptional regulator, MocR family, contains an aminotransferase domain [Paenibacillus catalpae]|uniref:DNA-binding transcriptional regulator, MocR family, contains an aminotransferase domain n=1 Tax=Paenibacillus catalpae TaxID=1045775 RepID=A0A1I2DMD5_9BACL|nr:PLP-dependent aminotransferase family protein [Paenibacillus catalpae]SFE81598.1 DNA-binding transcriptional regulator, MocR family, contains an aminotransferase domain [Paenibacillus catalpae]
MKKYFSILSDMEEKIRQGVYHPGQKLPSVRSAAEMYGCSISTITRAYAELEKRHAIYSVPQSGFYVVVKPGDWRDNRDSEMIYFATVLPDLDAFPYLDFQHCLNKAIDIYKYDLFTYGDPLGLESFRHTLVSHLANDQVFTKAERIIVTSGAQQALEIVAKMPFPNGRDAVLVEQPSYDRYLRFLETERTPVYGIARTAAGIDLRELERWFKSGKIKFFYTMSRYHNPLGTSYSAEERRSIAKLAAKYDVFILEDDYMADLGSDRQNDPIYASDGGEHVIYVKSFSKIIFPGLRVGAVVLPERLLKTFYAYKIYPDTSLLSQAALEVYIKNGMYERHKHKIGSMYASRMQALNESVARYNEPGLMEVPDIPSGIYTHFKLKPTVNVDRLLKRLADRNISVVPGKGFYLSHYLEREKFLRISISQTRPEQIDQGVKVIVEEVRKGS